MPFQIPISLLIFIPLIAFLYASVGFGGASGYLAAMSLFSFSPSFMASTALSLNIIVSSISFTNYYRSGHFQPRLLFPFLATSVPFAFLGGYIHVPNDIYLILLYTSLTYVALRMLFSPSKEASTGTKTLPLWTALLSGAMIGLLSGMIGIGGGIFLSPLIVLTGWGTPKQAASSSAGFIFVNSASGLIGRFLGGNFEVGYLGLALVPLGILGAIIGSYIGARRLSNQVVRRLLGIILLIAVIKFVTTYSIH